MDEAMWMCIAAIFAIGMTILSSVEGVFALIAMIGGTIVARLGLHLAGTAIAKRLTGDRK